MTRANTLRTINLTELIVGNDYSVNVISHNIHSIPSNIEEFLLDFDNVILSDSIIAFSETRLSDEIEHLYNIPNFSAFFNSRNAHGGGVAVYTANTLTSSKLVEFTLMLPEIETVCVHVSFKEQDCTILNVYRPPKEDLQLFIIRINDILSKIDRKFHSVKLIVMEDFILNLLRIENDRLPLEYLTTMYSHGCMPYIVRPTRVTRSTSPLIDNIWLNDESLLVSSGVIRNCISDHFPIFVKLKIVPSMNRGDNVVFYQKRVINEVNKSMFSRCLAVVDWNTITTKDNVNDMYDSFVEVVTSNFDHCFPSIQKRKKKLDVLKPYITPEIKSLIKEKHLLQRLHNKRPITFEDHFKSLRNNLNKKIRKVKQLYYSQ